MSCGYSCTVEMRLRGNVEANSFLTSHSHVADMVMASSLLVVMRKVRMALGISTVIAISCPVFIHF